MKILLLSETASNYKCEYTGYNGRGWIESLQELLKCREEISELGIAFPHNSDSIPVCENKITYFPIKKHKYKNKIFNFIDRWSYKIEDNNEIEKLHEIINQFNPDIIHVFGTESWLTQAVFNKKNIPCVVHIQGLLLPYSNNYLPYNIQINELIFNNLIHSVRGIGLWHFKNLAQKKAEREYNYFKNIKYTMGRTNWDNRISKLLAPNSVYFQVDEILRDPFYSTSYTVRIDNITVITSTISNTLYKGLDVIIKTAQILKKENFLFEWKVIGVDHNSSTTSLFKSKYDINNFTDLNIDLLGVKNADELVSILMDTTIFVHQSYLDNSPNSLCEAQLLGVPVIATAVGGVQTLITDNFDGFIVPTNDPYYAAALISQISQSAETLQRISINGRKKAQDRHNRIKIVDSVIDSYKIIHKNHK